MYSVSSCFIYPLFPRAFFISSHSPMFYCPAHCFHLSTLSGKAFKVIASRQKLWDPCDSFHLNMAPPEMYTHMSACWWGFNCINLCKHLYSMSVWSMCALCGCRYTVSVCAPECVGLTGEVVCRESLGKQSRVSMQQIKTGLFHFQLSVMREGIRKPPII